MTGRYPHRNGARGFEPISSAVPTLQERLHREGYLNGILGKAHHLQPESKFCWDYLRRQPDLGAGRDPDLYYQYAKEFFEAARESKRPFLLMANTHDPHRPFPESAQEQKKIAKSNGKFLPPKANRFFKPEEIVVPRFLPDIPDVRKEVAQYFAAVHRCDEMVGKTLAALEESGYSDNTLVMFLSDHGMAFPFAKTNCYLNSTKTPWIVRWPKRTSPGRVDRSHFISGIDFMPTVLEAAGAVGVDGMDGRSFLPVLLGEQQENRNTVYTVFHQTSAKREYPMRCVQDDRYAYIFNAWADGETVFRNESQSGLSFKAMQMAARTDEEIAARVDHFLYRVPEELYDLQADPNALHNLVEAPEFAEERDRMKAVMREFMERTEDPLLGRFDLR